MPTGLTQGTLCQKDDTTFEFAVAEWNELHSSDPFRNGMLVELAINHYSSVPADGATKRVLLITEGTPTWPKNKLSNFKNYHLTLASNSALPGASDVPWFNSPTSLKKTPPEISCRGEMFTIIAADKVSLVHGELYSLRRLIIAACPDEIALFGTGWNANYVSRVRKLAGEFLAAIRAGIAITWRPVVPYLLEEVETKGPITDKFDAYKLNKFAIVIENNMEIRTEKLFDAIEGGALPIYVGPDSDDGIDERLYLRAKSNVKAVKEAMDLARQIDYEHWLSIREEWMSTASYRMSSKQRFFNCLNDIQMRFSVEN